MPSVLTPTRQALANLASPDEFEALAAAVLRAADPRYASLLHVGTNAQGRAVRSPVDGIDVVIDASERRLIAAQHTITAREGLRRKWLDPVEGDLAKTLRIFEVESAAGRVTAATLALSCTHEPDAQLILDVKAQATQAFQIELWTASRLADFLDREPEGQWLRQQYLLTLARRLSRSQAIELGRRSLEAMLPLVPHADTIDRALDARLDEFAQGRRGVGFVIGESGLGKSVALRNLGERWLAAGGLALVLGHEEVERAVTLEQALSAGLRAWAPALDEECGSRLLAWSTSAQPLLLVVEDVNRSSNPARVIERLVGWTAGSERHESGQPARAWRALCPVWPSKAGLSDSDVAKRVKNEALFVTHYERAESIRAIRRRAEAVNVALSDLQANDWAQVLGDDPLLIGVNADWTQPNANGAIASYVSAKVNAAAGDELLPAELWEALGELTQQMIRARKLTPTWVQLSAWFDARPSKLHAVRSLLQHGAIVRLDGAAGKHALAYRHDRVRDHLVAQSIVSLAARDQLPEELWADPFFAQALGTALLELETKAVEHAERCNPAALFAALAQSTPSTATDEALVAAAQRWTSSPSFAQPAQDQQRQHAVGYLARMDGPRVATLAQPFPASFARLEALARNGDVDAAVRICFRSDPGFADPWRDRIIAHAVAGDATFVVRLSEWIRTIESHGGLAGALNLAGEIGDPILCDALADRWTREADKPLSSSWLWAVLRCCPKAAHPLATTVCDRWAQLPDDEPGAAPPKNPRWDLGGYSLRWGVRRKPEPATIAFLIDRARNDPRLEHVLSYVLMQVDSPEAVLYTVESVAKTTARLDGTDSLNLRAMDLRDTWDPQRHGRVMGVASRQALARVWQDMQRNRFERRAAFSAWAKSPTPVEVRDLAVLESDPVLADDALRTRLAAQDASALPLLQQRLASAQESVGWWYQARSLGIGQLHAQVQAYLQQRRNPTARDGWGDHIVSELLMEDDSAFAVDLLVREWDQLKTSGDFVQAALYLARPNTLALAHDAIAGASEPLELLKHIDMHWGIYTQGRTGVTRLAQLQALEPYYAQMDQHTIERFFEAANRLGLMAWRVEHLDKLLVEFSHSCCTATDASLFASLDRELEHYQTADRWYSGSHWLELREREGLAPGPLLDRMAGWVRLRDDKDALGMLCEALLLIGSRDDLALLDALSPSLRAQGADAIANAIYGVRRRSLG